MAEFQNTIDLLGDDIVAKSIIDKTFSGKFSDNGILILRRRAFTECKYLTSVDIPSVTTIEKEVFKNCSNLESADFSSAKTIESQTFYYCSKLKTVILRGSTLCAIKNIDAFVLSPFYTNGTGGTVYVPQALITEYQNATNWSTLYAAGTCNFVAIEGSEYE